MHRELIAELEREIDPDYAAAWAPFFGIKPGKYGEHDILLGIHVPTLRKIAARYKHMPEESLLELLHSPIHDYRFAALVILSLQYPRNPQYCHELFLQNMDYINNWDLVDGFAPKILGRWALEQHDESKLRELSYSLGFWQRRMAIVAYQYFYRRGVLANGLDVIDWNLEDAEPQVHKACGWMLRVIYVKIDKHLVESYIIDNYTRMPRACLRNAIERMPEDERQKFLRGVFDAQN